MICQWSISDFTMVLFVYYYSRLPNLSKACHFDNLLTIVRSVIDHCDTIAIADYRTWNLTQNKRGLCPAMGLVGLWMMIIMVKAGIIWD